MDRAYEVYHQHAHGPTFVNQLSIVPDSQEFLRSIATKHTLAIATGAHPQVLHDLVMPKFHIPDVFAKIMTIYDLDDMAHAKPHPYMAQAIMKELGFTPEESVLVGDAATDIQMAQGAGIEPVAVLTGHLNRQEAEELGVRYIIDQVTELEPVLEQIFPVG